MPIDWSRYPQTWGTIRRRILARATPAGSDVAVCEWCGAPNGAYVERNPANPREYRLLTDAEADALGVAGGRVTRIVLTVAHLGAEREDGTPGDKHDKMDCRDVNLAALCQRCHLKYDIAEHVENAHRTRRVKRVDAGQGVLPGFEGILERGR